MLRLATIVCALLLPQTIAAQEPSVVLNPDKDAADVAMALGDSGQLGALLDNASDPVRIELVAGYKARAELRIEDSNRHAERCSQLALVDLTRHYMSNVRCRALRAGNALVEGDYSKWSRLLHTALDDVDDHVRGLIHRELPGKYTDNVKLFFPGTVSLPEMAGSLPTFSRPGKGTYVQRVASQQAVSGSDDSLIREPFFVEAEVNGVRARFVVDTGAAATVIGGKTARALGLDKNNSKGQVNYDLIFEGRQVRTAFRKVESLRLGDFLAKGATVLISGDESVLNLIGLDLIKQMGGLRFSSTRLTFEDASSCKGKLTLASDLVASQRSIVGTVRVDGSPGSAEIDTGNREHFTVYGSDTHRPAVSRVSVNGLPSEFVRRVEQRNPLGLEYNLGAGILEDFDMIVDLRTAKFCLEEKR